MIFLDLPGLAAVAGFCSLPVKRVGRYFAEGPAYRHSVAIDAAQDDAVSVQAALRRDDVIVLRPDVHDPPLLLIGVEEPDGSADRSLFPGRRRITNPQVLNGVAIHHPAEQDLALLVGDGAVVMWETEITIPRTNESVEHLGLIAEGRVRPRRSKLGDHRLARVLEARARPRRRSIVTGYSRKTERAAGGQS